MTPPGFGSASWAALLLIVLLVAGSAGSTESGFDVSVTTGSMAEFEGAKDFRATGAMFASRFNAESTSERLVGFWGNATSLEIHRFELQWVQAGTSYRGDNVPVGTPQETVVPAESASLRYVSSDGEAAFVMVVDSLRGQVGQDSWRAMTVATDPAVGLMEDDSTYGAPPGPNEPGGWRQEGQYIAFQTGAFDAVGSGRLRLYWFQGTLTLKTGEGVQSFESRVWDDPSGGREGPYVRHAVWHELWADDAKVHAAASPRHPNINSVLFASAVSLDDVATMSFDSAEDVRGSLPPTSGSVGPSLWIQGQMNADFEIVEAKGATMQQYRVRAAGRADAATYGGTYSIPLSAETLGTTSALVALVGLAFLFRDLLAEMLARGSFYFHSKLRQDQVLDHGVRDTIFHLVQATPGIAFLALRDAVRTAGRPDGIGTGTLLHHLDQLQRFGLLASRRVGRFRRYYADGRDGRGKGDARLALLQGQTARQVAKAILARPGLSKREVQAILLQGQAISLPGVLHHLKRLEADGLLSSRMVGRRRCYEPTNLLRSGLDASA